MKAKNYAGVDLFRIPAALMVAAIHIAPFSTWNRVGDVLLTYCPVSYTHLTLPTN